MNPFDAKRKVASALLGQRAVQLFDSWFDSRDDLVLVSAARGQFVDWVVQKVCRVSREKLADWYVLRAGHVRGAAQQDHQGPTP